MAHEKNSADQHARMTQTAIPGLVMSLAIPTMVSMLITVIYNTADTFYVSQISKSASAAVGAVYSIMALIQALGFGFGVGAGSLISRRLGAKDHEAADRYASSAFFAAVMMGFAIAGVGLSVLPGFLRLLGCTETMMPHAMPYARFILIGAPINCANFVMNNTLRSQGYSKYAMIGLTAGGILNIILDPIFIFGLQLGTGGAALATMLSQVVTFVILMGIYLSGRTIVHIHVKNISRRFADYRLIVATGIPTICRQGLGSVAAAALNIQAIGYGGDAAGAAITIANKLYILVRNLVIGLGQGFQPVAGYNWGAGRRDRTWKAFVFTSKVSTVMCLGFSAFAAVFARSIIGAFSSDPDVQRLGIETLYFLSCAMPVLGFSTHVNQLYQCLGFKAKATFLASCRQGIYFLPAVFLMPLIVDLKGVQSAQPLADILTMVTSIPFAISFYRKYVKPGNLTAE